MNWTTTKTTTPPGTWDCAPGKNAPSPAEELDIFPARRRGEARQLARLEPGATKTATPLGIIRPKQSARNPSAKVSGVAVGQPAYFMADTAMQPTRANAKLTRKTCSRQRAAFPTSLFRPWGSVTGLMHTNRASSSANARTRRMSACRTVWRLKRRNSLITKHFHAPSDVFRSQSKPRKDR